jgi:hypothetical protein
MFWSRRIEFEQAVYGSFPFWNKGYTVLAQSPNCKPEWVAALREAAQKFGEPPRDVERPKALLVKRLLDRTRMIVGVSSPGADDRGRPGALAFHGLFISTWQYRKTGGFPFPLTGALQTAWTSPIDSLPRGTFRLPPLPSLEESDDPLRDRVVKALAGHGRVAVTADRPIDDLAESVWQRLPDRLRYRLDLATWTFRPGPDYHLLAHPSSIRRGGDPSLFTSESLLPLGRVGVVA